MTVSRGSVLSNLLRPEDRAIEAVVGRYQRVAGAVTRVARTLAGKDDLRVVLGSSSKASATEVVIDPNLFTAAYERRAPVTVEETALASALHEVIHLVSSDFDETRPIPPHWLPEDEEPDPTEPAPEYGLLESLDKAGGPPAEALFFAVEDARQELVGMTDYPGARSVLGDLYRSALREGLAGRSPLARYTTSCFMSVGSYIPNEVLERHLDSRSGAAWADSLSTLEAIAEAQDPWEVADHTLQLLRIAQAHDLLSTSVGDEVSTGRQAREEAERDVMNQALDQVRLFSPSVADADRYRQTRQAMADPEGLDQRAAALDRVTGDGIEQLLMVSQAPIIYLPTGQGGKLTVLSVPDAFRAFSTRGRDALVDAARVWGVDERRVAGELHPLFIANQRRGLRSGFDAGDLSPHAALLLGGGLYQRMFERRSVSTRRSYAVSVLVDGSASMLQPRQLAGPGNRRPWGLAAAMLGAWTLAAMCNELSVDFEVALFNRAFAARPDDTEWTYTRRRAAALGELRQSHGAAADRLTSTVNHYVLSAFHEPWRRSDDLLAGLFWAAAHGSKADQEARRHPRQAPPVSMFEKAANVDELNVTYAAERLTGHGARVRVLVVLADGMTRGSVDALAQAVEEVDGRGTTVLGIGVGDDTVASAYRHHQVVARPDDLARSMVVGVRTALSRGLAIDGGDTWWIRASRRAFGNELGEREQRIA